MPAFVALRTKRRLATTICLCAGLLVSFAVNPGSANAAPSRTTAVSWGVSVFNALNSQRALHRLAPLGSSGRLLNIAHLHNLEMANYNSVSHQLPGELTARTRIARAGFSATTAGENLTQTTSWTLSAAYALQSAMYNEPRVLMSRSANILSTAFRYVGVDVTIDTVHHKLWITEDFSILPPVATPAAVTVSMAGEMLKAMNAERALHGRAALRMNSLLIRSAHGHNLRMAAANLMSHLVPGEPGFLARLLQVGYSPRAAAENIGWNSDRSVSGVLYLQQLMYNELPPDDAHRVNILNATYRDVGIDVYMDTAHNRLWITQDFGLHA